MDEVDDDDDDDISLIFRAPDLPLSLILLPCISPAARPYEFCECVLSSAPDLFPQNFFSSLLTRWKIYQGPESTLHFDETGRPHSKIHANVRLESSQKCSGK